MKIQMTENVPNKHYSSTCGMVLQREYDTKAPSGYPMGGRWVLRDSTGKMLDFDQYSNDLAERYNLKLY